MAVKIFQGNEFRIRGSNKKYHQLDNLDQLHEDLIRESIDEYSKRTGIPYNCIAYIVKKYFPQEWLDDIAINIKRKRLR